MVPRSMKTSLTPLACCISNATTQPISMFPVITFFFATLAGATAALSLDLAGSNPIATLWTFPNETWIENLAVRANGDVLCTSLNRAAIYQVDPFNHVAETVHQFASTDGCLGITETASDVFVVVTANVSLKTNTAWPGSAKIWRVDVRAWELVSYSIEQCTKTDADAQL
jgi:streptogramin lyase